MGFFQLIIALPGMIITIIKIIGKINEFQGKGFWDIVRLVGEIIGLILGLAPTDKKEARAALKALHTQINVATVDEAGMAGLLELKAHLQKKCSAAGCPSAADTARHYRGRT